ncbi:hypothetical protein C8J56DRAFT_1064428 [Mycena floridula]|nr:hypothetical protein C8J56DRAFT_1064428 [Mycena floridula]
MTNPNQKTFILWDLSSCPVPEGLSAEDILEVMSQSIPLECGPIHAVAGYFRAEQFTTKEAVAFEQALTGFKPSLTHAHVRIVPNASDVIADFFTNIAYLDGLETKSNWSLVVISPDSKIIINSYALFMLGFPTYIIGPTSCLSLNFGFRHLATWESTIQRARIDGRTTIQRARADSMSDVVQHLDQMQFGTGARL